MRCIPDIKKIIGDIETEITEQLRAEELGGGFDDDWVEEMKALNYVLKDLQHIVQEHEFYLEQTNK